MSEAQHSVSRSFYDRISHVDDLIGDAGKHTAGNKGFDVLAAQPRERVLEVGFGTGHSLVELAQAVGPKFPLDEIVGVLQDIASVLRPGERLSIVSMATTPVAIVRGYKGG